MRFPNAFDGVSKIRTSQILAVVATALLFISAILGLAMIPLSNGGPGNALYALLAAFGFVAMAAGIISIIALIINIIGINRASKDEPIFKTALIAVVVNILLSCIGSAAGENGSTLSDLMSILSSVAQVITCILIIRGIISLADQLGDGEMVERGNTTRNLVLCLFAVSLVLKAVSDFFIRGSGTASSILTLVAAILSLVQFIVYLSYLTRAKNMLA